MIVAAGNNTSFV
jgi:hypothetical protein